jgi:hypothetical protein
MQDLFVPGQEPMKPVAKKWQNRTKNITFLDHCWVISKKLCCSLQTTVFGLGKNLNP